MGDRITWFDDCPKCGKKDGVENYEQLTSNLKTEYCNYCDYSQKWDVTDDNYEIKIKKGSNNLPQDNSNQGEQDDK